MNIQGLPLELNAINTESNKKIQLSNINNKENFASTLNDAQLKSTQVKKETPDNIREEHKKILYSKRPANEDTLQVHSENTTLENLTDKIELLDEKAILEVIAGIFEKSTDEIEQILASLQIGIADLLHIENLQHFIMQMYNVENPADLLLIPEASDNIKIISELLSQYSAQDAQVTNERTHSEQTIDIHTSKTVIIEKKIETPIKQDEKHNVNEIVELKPATTSRPADLIQNNEELSSNENGFLNQNNSSEKFIQHLSQSLGNALQWQQEQVNQVKEVVASKDTFVEPKMVLDQIIQNIKTSVSDDNAQISIRLKPEHLGQLTMKVVSQQGIMTAQFTVENEKIKALIEQNIQDLQDVLGTKGIAIQKLEVTVGQNQNEDRHLYEKSKSHKNVSKIIDRLINEPLDNEPLPMEQIDEYDTSNVNFIA